MEGSFCKLHHAGCGFLRNICGADFLGGSVLIFVGVVKKTGFRNDFDRGKRLPADDAAGKFPAADVFFYNDFIFITEGFFQRLTVLFFCIYNIYANAGAAGTGLYYDRQT